MEDSFSTLFSGMSDSEITEISELCRSTIFCHHTEALKTRKHFSKENQDEI